jgi:NitT/TauT family transport system substrate-binding protein
MNDRRFRASFIVAFLVACCLTFTSCSGSKSGSANPSVIRIGILQHASSIPLIVADENGYFSKRGLRVEFQVLTPQQHMPALLLKKTDILSPSSFPVIFSTYQQNPGFFQCYLVGGESTTGDVLYGIVVKKDSSYKNLGDLVGKTIGSTSKFTVVNLRNVLQHRFGDQAQKTVVRELSDMSLLVEGLKNGELDAAVFDQPALSSQTLQGDFRIIEKNFRAKYLSNPYWSGCGMAANEWINANRQSYELFLDSIDDALQFCEKSPVQAREIFIRRFQLKDVNSAAIGMYVYPNARYAPSPEIMNALAAMLVQNGLLKESLDARTLFYKK